MIALSHNENSPLPPYWYYVLATSLENSSDVLEKLCMKPEYEIVSMFSTGLMTAARPIVARVSKDVPVPVVGICIRRRRQESETRRPEPPVL